MFLYGVSSFFFPGVTLIGHIPGQDKQENCYMFVTMYIGQGLNTRKAKENRKLGRQE